VRYLLQAHELQSEWVSAQAKRVVNRFRTTFVNEEGLISRDYPANARTIFDNFDDLAPFLAWWGAEDILLDQVKRLRCEDFERLLPFGNLLHAYKIDEYLGVLNVVKKTTGDSHASYLLDDAVERSWKYFGDEDLGLAEFYDFDSSSRSSFFSPWAAGLLETFLEIDVTRESVAQRVERVLDLWWNHPFAQSTGMLPFRGSFERRQQMTDRLWAKAGRWACEPPIRWTERTGSPVRDALRRSKTINRYRRLNWQWGRSGLWSQLMKSNTTPIFLAIALYARNRDPKWRLRISRWFDAVSKDLVGPDGVFGTIHNGKKVGLPTLVAGFIMIDVACDTWWHVDRDDRYLDMAYDVAQACLRWRWEDGLIPMTPSADINHLDGQIDFSIALRRIAELRKDAGLFNQSVALMRAALAMHDTPEGYCTHVRRDGSMVKLAENTIDPKYNALVLKGLASLATLDRPIYGSPDLMDLFKDR
jgi:hypothetical protein